LRVAHDLAHSALPDAPVRDDLAATADRPLRRLRRLADHLESAADLQVARVASCAPYGPLARMIGQTLVRKVSAAASQPASTAIP